jgi:small subunit ribosomal protein S4e
MKTSIKRIVSPRTWHIPRKTAVFTTRPKPGAHPIEAGLPLVIIMRDMLKKATTAREVKKLLNANDILVDGKRRRDHRFIVGLFDVLSIPSIKEHYRMTLDNKGRTTLKPIDEKEKQVKICRITGKKMLKGKKIQYHLHDGRTIIAENDAAVGDTLVISLPDQHINAVIPLKNNMHMFLFRGKHAGDTGILKEIKGDKAVYTKDGKDIETLKNYVFVTGEKKPVITI